jgi:hypothetical protein
MSSYGYAPTAQSWGEGRPGIARVVAIGIFATALRPAGYLTVTYQKTTAQDQRATRAENDGQGKICPRCAETVKAAAQVCRYCGHDFGSASS